MKITVLFALFPAVVLSSELFPTCKRWDLIGYRTSVEAQQAFIADGYEPFVVGITDFSNYPFFRRCAEWGTLEVHSPGNVSRSW
jgi:hypothetical protein